MDAGLVITLGRAPDCTLVFDDARMSARHAQLESLGDGTFRLTDLGSRNGTFIDDSGMLVRVEAATTVRAAQRLRFGDCEATVRELFDMARDPGRRHR